MYSLIFHFRIPRDWLTLDVFTDLYNYAFIEIRPIRIAVVVHVPYEVDIHKWSKLFGAKPRVIRR